MVKTTGVINMNMKEYTLEEWKAEGVKRFGEDPTGWKFKCPACGRINTGIEYNELGANINSMYSECIGRINGKGSDEKNEGNGCDWAAFGLLGTLSKGVMVQSPSGEMIEIFDFAEV
ncbi:VVA0879 family protein [Clostridium sp.]|uniref:VVA0879 family protein n=1 Tax=Clostridium sp. TaxID=1506 RepID=UPI002FCA4BAD